LAMLPSVIPKVGLMQVISTCMHSKYTTIAKLILNASKKVNDRRDHDEVAWSRGVANGAGHSRYSCKLMCERPCRLSAPLRDPVYLSPISHRTPFAYKRPLCAKRSPSIPSPFCDF
jgi:hypothetical protein